MGPDQARDSKAFLGRALLIGGAACWFYRIQLRNAADPDFILPELSPESERKWLSKDIDFTGLMSIDALDLLPHRVVVDNNGRKHIEIEGVRLGFAQVGLTIDPEDAIQRAQLARFRHGDEMVEFLVADPVTLYREKMALSTRRGLESDYLHLSVLREYLCWQAIKSAETLLTAQGLPVAESRRVLGFLADLRNRTPETLSDSRIARRIAPLLRTGDPNSDLIANQLGLFRAG